MSIPDGCVQSGGDFSAEDFPRRILTAAAKWNAGRISSSPSKPRNKRPSVKPRNKRPVVKLRNKRPSVRRRSREPGFHNDHPRAVGHDLSARVTDSEGNALEQAAVSSVSIEVFDRDTNLQIGETLNPAVDDVIEELQTNPIWTADAVGYNFSVTVAGAFFPPAARPIAWKRRSRLSAAIRSSSHGICRAWRRCREPVGEIPVAMPAAIERRCARSGSNWRRRSTSNRRWTPIYSRNIARRSKCNAEPSVSLDADTIVHIAPNGAPYAHPSVNIVLKTSDQMRRLYKQWESRRKNSADDDDDLKI